MRRITLSRRSFLGVAAAAGASLLAACSGPEEKPDAALGPSVATRPALKNPLRATRTGTPEADTPPTGAASPTREGTPTASAGDAPTVRIADVPAPLLTHASWMRDRLVEHLDAVESGAGADLTIRMAAPGDHGRRCR